MKRTKHERTLDRMSDFAKRLKAAYVQRSRPKKRGPKAPRKWTRTACEELVARIDEIKHTHHDDGGKRLSDRKAILIAFQRELAGLPAAARLRQINSYAVALVRARRTLGSRDK